MDSQIKHVMKQGQIVTPKVKVNRTSMGTHYVVRRVDGENFFIMDDFGIERMCYQSDFEVVKSTLSLFIDNMKQLFKQLFK